MFTAILLALASLGSADTPIEPIESDMIQLTIDSGRLTAVCDGYDEVYWQFVAVLDYDTEMAEELLGFAVVRKFEQGWGEAARMTVEAEALFTDYLHTCI